MKKTIIGVLAIPFVIISLCAQVFAYDNMSLHKGLALHDDNSKNIVLYGMNPPGYFSGIHDLGDSNYEGEFEDIWYPVYTNKRFKGNASGRIYMSIRTTQDCTVYLCDYDDGSETPIEVSSDTTEYIAWKGLVTDHSYYFKFVNEASSPSVHRMDGTFTISHSNLS